MLRAMSAQSEQLPGHVDDPVMEYAESIDIAAPQSKVWAMVTALDRYGEWSNENTGGYWRKGADGEPGTGQVGDMFVGVNKLDGMEWKAPVEIIRRIENEDFAFVTGGLDLNIVLWRYQLAPNGDGTTLTESWMLRKLSPRMIENGQKEVDYRSSNAREGIRATLTAIKAAAEA